MLKEVQENQEAAIKEKEKETTEANNKVKKLEKAEKEHEKAKAQYKTDLEVTRETINTLTKANNELKEKIATKEAYVSALTEELTGDAANEDISEVEEADIAADVHRATSVDTAGSTQRVSMAKKSTPPKCNACDKSFKANSDLEKHVSDVHTDSECDLCNKKLKTKRKLEDHICPEADIVPQKCEKSYCNKEFVNSASLKKHMKNTHFGNQRTVTIVENLSPRAT